MGYKNGHALVRSSFSDALQTVAACQGTSMVLGAIQVNEALYSRTI